MPKVVRMSTHALNKLGAYTFEIDKHTEELLRLFTGSFRPERLKRGDKVEVTITGYVDKIDADGQLVTVKDTRAPFSDSAQRIDVLRKNVRLLERAPAPIKVGDTITGRQVKDTPWKRGTMLRGATFGESDRRYVLTADGTWRAINSGREYAFDEVEDFERYVVEHAPGK